MEKFCGTTHCSMLRSHIWVWRVWQRLLPFHYASSLYELKLFWVSVCLWDMRSRARKISVNTVKVYILSSISVQLGGSTLPSWIFWIIPSTKTPRSLVVKHLNCRCPVCVQFANESDTVRSLTTQRLKVSHILQYVSIMSCCFQQTQYK